MSLSRWAVGAALGGAAIVMSFAAFAQPAPSWATVGGIFAQNCTRCHGGALPRAGLDLTTYASAISGSSSGPVIVCGDAAASKLVARITGQVAPQMPRGAPPLAPEQIAAIQGWINAQCPGA
ncbi:MAG: hypothetical protein IT535_12395 [Bauldia sp.]|nr:hypothetical protein [Bauldia sp.]